MTSPIAPDTNMALCSRRKWSGARANSTPSVSAMTGQWPYM